MANLLLVERSAAYEDLLFALIETLLLPVIPDGSRDRLVAQCEALSVEEQAAFIHLLKSFLPNKVT